MNLSMENICQKYELNIIKQIDRNNVVKIILFLESEKCDYIDELLENYLDLFIISFDQFLDRYNRLKEKYGINLIEKISLDLNILEEF